MKRVIAPVMCLAALALPAAAETENPEICAALAGRPGIYLVRSTSDIKPLAAASRERLQRDIRVYVIPQGSRGQEEQVVHLRVTSKAARIEDNRADSVRLKRNKVSSACRQSLFRRDKRDFDNEDERNDSRVADYNDFADNAARASRSLNEWHFRWDAGETRRDCRYTADHAAPVEGFGKRKPGKPLVRIASIDEPVAEERQPEIASLTSVLVHQPNRAQSCFAFRLFQNRDAKWLPTLTRIEAWSFGARRNDRDKQVFTLRWIP